MNKVVEILDAFDNLQSLFVCHVIISTCKYQLLTCQIQFSAMFNLFTKWFLIYTRLVVDNTV